MTKSASSQQKRAKWSSPEVTSIDQDLGDIENGFNIGNDGAGGPTTSLS